MEKRKKKAEREITKNWIVLQKNCKKFGKRRLYKKFKLAAKNCIELSKRKILQTLKPPKCIEDLDKMISTRDCHTKMILIQRLWKKEETT